ncbi:DNA-directed RNA polymerase subunit beta' [Mycolicibacterium canariasense]|uniref:DNA-directed RNA polymerase subunit beta n=1 Tax=Mycolicibacterium canariasense TaxID=228230 RepID=A0A100WAF9_MYCCR|nr:hypothetical protein [Mycolicibacterium canariasense]MCV7208802.1 hypothetical protein [Mycolicibacterium canariasense]GAS94411.1 DNA-directed RNA polymerase subunit beta' [Mycolicibacterium canariasense]
MTTGPRPEDIWTVTAIQEHDDGSRTLTMRNNRGNTRTENYPLGSTLTVIRRTEG